MPRRYIPEHNAHIVDWYLWGRAEVTGISEDDRMAMKYGNPNDPFVALDSQKNKWPTVMIGDKEYYVIPCSPQVYELMANTFALQRSLSESRVHLNANAKTPHQT